MCRSWLNVTKNVNFFPKNKKLAPLPLIPIFVEEPFRQQGLEFMGETNSPSCGKHNWILTATDYFTKCVESIPTQNVIDSAAVKFSKENIFSIFGCPIHLVIDNS